MSENYSYFQYKISNNYNYKNTPEHLRVSLRDCPLWRKSISLFPPCLPKFTKYISSPWCKVKYLCNIWMRTQAIYKDYDDNSKNYNNYNNLSVISGSS